MNAPIAIPAKVRRIVPTLGSPVDGEALGACRAIGRTLHGAGLDFHALAAAIKVDEGEPDPVAIFHGLDPDPAGWREAWSRPRKHRFFTEKQEAEQRAQMRFCKANNARLGPHERAFVDSISRSNIGLSYRQAAWLADIADRLDWEGRQP